MSSMPLPMPWSSFPAAVPSFSVPAGAYINGDRAQQTLDFGGQENQNAAGGSEHEEARAVDNTPVAVCGRVGDVLTVFWYSSIGRSRKRATAQMRKEWRETIK